MPRCRGSLLTEFAGGTTKHSQLASIDDADPLRRERKAKKISQPNSLPQEAQVCR